MRDIADHDTGLARAQIVQAREHGLAIVERTQRIDHHDGVEWSRQGPQELGILDVADEKGEIGVRLARLADHAGAEIDAHSERRLERGEHVAGAASKLEHASAFRNEKFHVEQILMVEEGAAREPLPARGRARVGAAADLALARRHAGRILVPAGIHRHLTVQDRPAQIRTLANSAMTTASHADPGTWLGLTAQVAANVPRPARRHSAQVRRLALRWTPVHEVQAGRRAARDAPPRPRYWAAASGRLMLSSDLRSAAMP